MHSFTFSSERVPSNGSKTVLVLALACSLILLALIEHNWQLSGAHTEYIDSKARWAHERDKLSRSVDHHRTAILGDSRMLYGFSVAQFSKKIPQTPLAQLSIAAAQPFAVLRDLATAASFDGIIILSYSPLMLLDSLLNGQQSWVDYRRNHWTPASRANLLIGDWVDPWLVSRQSYYGLRNTLISLIKRRTLPSSPLLVSVAENRDTDADYRRVDIKKHRARRRAEAEQLFPAITPQELIAWHRNFVKLKYLVDRLKSRGARIVFVRLPTEGTWHRLESSKFPKQKYWEKVLDQLDVPGLDFQYLVTTELFSLPDSQHLDKSQKVRFTDDLVNRLLKIGYY